MASASEDALAKLLGVYNFQHPGGQFDVHLRPGGRFFAPNFQARASWSVSEDGEMFIEWGKFGQYKLSITDPAARAFEGAAVSNAQSWRKMALRRPFTVAEMKLMDSEWELEHPGGKFNVEFRADGYNHFVCNAFPAHSHWRLDNADSATPSLYINWGKYGEYDLIIAADGESMTGSAKGQPDNWRKMTRLRTLGNVEEAHVHDH